MKRLKPDVIERLHSGSSVVSGFSRTRAYPVVSACHYLELMGVPRPPFPKNLREFQRQFATEEACQDYLVACRWPDGFVCPRCEHRRAYPVAHHGGSVARADTRSR